MAVAAAATVTWTVARFRASVGGTLNVSARSAFLFKFPSLATKGISPAAVSFRSRRNLLTCTALYKNDFSVTEEGTPETLDYRAFFIDSTGKKVSPWHDIPLHVGDGVFNFVAEIPKDSSAKMEVATDEPFTPIKQDIKKGKLRYYPYNINWNYGLLPQTWEDPSHANLEVEGALGDNDPVDVVEIGDARAKIGDVLKVKPVAALAMIDEGELDWKIVAISLNDPRASLVNDINDLEIYFPGTLSAIRDWFRDYKIPDGKPANQFGLGNKPANKIIQIQLLSKDMTVCFNFNYKEGNKPAHYLATCGAESQHIIVSSFPTHSLNFLLKGDMLTVPYLRIVKLSNP